MGLGQVIAVCVSGLARPGYKQALEIAKSVFPYDTFHMHWKGYDAPGVDQCKYFDEPHYDYHNLTETKYKPDCHIWRRYTKEGTGKIYRKPGLLEKTRANSKQTLAHYWLVNTLPEKYTTIIKLRYDTLLSTKVDFEPLLKKCIEQDTVIGIAGSSPGKDVDMPLKVHSYQDCRRCPGPYLWDHLIFHPRWKLKNVEKLWREKNLMGAEWGFYQVLHHQWNDNNYLNVEGGNVLTAHANII
jgi:hypothetical protein